MPKPTVIDPGDRGMVSQATGKPVTLPATSSGNGIPNTIRNIYNNIVQTASMPSNMLKPTVRQDNPPIQHNALIQTSSMSAPRQISTGVSAPRPASINIGSVMRNGIRRALENDVEWDDGGSPMLSGGARPGQEQVGSDVNHANLPDLDPVIESMREHLGGMMTKPSGDQTSFAPTSTGAVPSVSSAAMAPSEPVDLPDIGPSIEGIRDYLGSIVTRPDEGADMVPVGDTSSGAVPMVDSDAIRPSEPRDIEMPSMPSVDGMRDYLSGIVTKPRDEEDSVPLAALSTGATPSIGRGDIGTSGKNIFERDEMWNLIGDTESNQAYIRDAMENGGLSKKDANDIMSRGSWWEQLDKKFSQPLGGMSDASDNRETLGDMTVMDDGTKYDYDHMTADTMTGTQYMHYAEMGMGGRPVEQIDPTKTYSKRREHINYGFTPFVPDQTAYANMIADNVMDVPHRLGTMLSGLRETVTPDYAINYGGGRISGRDFDKLSTAYLNQFYYNDRFDPERFLTRPDGNDNVTALVREYAVPDKDGRETYHYGRLTAMWANEDGTYTAEFSDGSSVDVSQEYIDSISNNDGSVTMTDSARVPASQARGSLPADLDSLNDVDSIIKSAQENGGSPLDYADVIYIPDLVLSDGTSIPYSDVERIYWDETPGDDEGPGDDDVSYEFKRFGIGPLSFDNKPRRLNQQEMFKTNDRGGLDVDLSDIGNNAVDWTLGSLPISIGSTMPWVYSASGATSSLAGADPASYDPTTDSYGLIAGNYDKQGRLRYGVAGANGKRDGARSDSTKWWNAAGNAAVPLTEMLVGSVGEQLVPLEKIFRSELPSNPTTWQVIKNALVGAAGEGVEEDFGNIFDEITQYGPSGMFANPVTNANGETLRDMYGHEVRDYGTNAEDRLNSFFDPGELANAFAGGVTVDALMRMLPIASQLVPAVRRDAARRKTGVAQFVDPEEREKRTVSGAYSLGFDDGIDSLER